MTRRRILLIPLLVASTLMLTASGVLKTGNADESDAGAPRTATAHLVGPDGRAVGTVTLIEGPNGVLVQADVAGLSPGGHGFHIHTVGACEPDFSAAGDHFNPGESGHGFTYEGGQHAGDLPNIYAAADGTARADFFTEAVTLTPGAENSIFDADGSAIIIHAKPDSYGESAGAGDVWRARDSPRRARACRRLRGREDAPPTQVTATRRRPPPRQVTATRRRPPPRQGPARTPRPADTGSGRVPGPVRPAVAFGRSCWPEG